MIFDISLAIFLFSVRNSIEAFDKLNCLIGAQLDSFYTGGLMEYLATNHQLERYHGDLDLLMKINYYNYII